MRLNVRFEDAHRGFIPTPRVRSKVVLVDDRVPHVRPMQPRATMVQTPAPPYVTPERERLPHISVVPYDWEKRKAGVMARFKNVPNWVQPFGYTTAYAIKELPCLAADEQDQQQELTYLISTQNLELAPLWAELAANGLTAFSKDAPKEGENGETEVGDVPDVNLDSVGLALIYSGGRAEAFAKERDYQTWHTTRPRRAHRVVNEAGQRGIVPRLGSVFSKEELQAMLSRKTRETKDEGEVGLWLDALPLTPERNEFHAEDAEARYTAGRGGYGAGDPCPRTKDKRADGTPLCVNGRVPITEDGIITDEDDCPSCNGEGTVMGLLGSALLATDERE